MDFDVDKFLSTTFKAREFDYPVPDLAPFFKEMDGDKPVWKVRGMTGAEMAKVQEAKERNRARSAIAQGLLSGRDDQMTEAVRELVGDGDAVPDEIARRIEMLTLASVQPQCTHQLATKMAAFCPGEFYALTTKIMELTGLGAEPGKPKRSSGKTT